MLKISWHFQHPSHNIDSLRLLQAHTLMHTYYRNATAMIFIHRQRYGLGNPSAALRWHS